VRTLFGNVFFNLHFKEVVGKGRRDHSRNINQERVAGIMYERRERPDQGVSTS